MATNIPYDLANKFIDEQNLKIPEELGFKYGLGEITEFSDCFYFDFKLLNLDGRDYGGAPLADAPGFIITKVINVVSFVTFGQLAELKK